MKPLALLLLLSAVPLSAAIEGVVLNRSTGQPQSGVTVTLTKLSQSGMQPGGNTVSGAGGAFKLETDAGNAHLITATYKGITYNLQLQPGAPTTGVQLMVADTSAKPINKAEQHMILVEADANETVVNETIIFKNESNLTWADPARGTLRFFVPAAAGDNVRVRATAPNGLPIERPAKKTGEAQVWMVDYPVKPGGETRFDVSYKIPAAQPRVFTTRILHPEGAARLVLPDGIKAEGQGLEPLGTEPSTRASIFAINNRSVSLTLSGAGRLRELAPTERAEGEGPTVDVIGPPGYERAKWWILGLMLAVLALSFVAQYMKGAPGRPKA